MDVAGDGEGGWIVGKNLDWNYAVEFLLIVFFFFFFCIRLKCHERC